MCRQWMRTLCAGHTWMAFALAGRFVAIAVDRTADVAATISATEQIAAEQIVRSVFAFAAFTSTHCRFACALTRLRIACVQSTNRSVKETIAFIATVRICDVQIPIEWFAVITDATRNTFFALAQFAGRHRCATGESRCHTGRITIAVLAGGEIVEAFFALAAVFAVEISKARALTVSITRNAIRTGRFTEASCEW